MNDPIRNSEAAIDEVDRTEIERLRADITDTQALYREVCVLLFFRYGITPTANKLYQLVRKGSMSAPAEALRRFWADLREKSRVRIEQPDLPEALKTAAGELVSQLWAQAREAADQQLEALRQAAELSVRSAEQARQAAERETQARRQAEELAQTRASAFEARVSQHERALAALQARHDAQGGQLRLAEERQRALEGALNGARRDFADELEKQREALRLAEARLEGAEKRALLEIERERQTAQRAQQEVLHLQQALHTASERYQSELAEDQKRSNALIQSLGVAEGRQQAQAERFTQMEVQWATAQEKSLAKDAQIAQLKRELDRRAQRIGVLEAKAESGLRSRRRKNVFSGT